jgi:hypothetical protein
LLKIMRPPASMAYDFGFYNGACYKQTRNMINTDHAHPTVKHDSH